MLVSKNTNCINPNIRKELIFEFTAKPEPEFAEDDDLLVERGSNCETSSVQIRDLDPVRHHVLSQSIELIDGFGSKLIPTSDLIALFETNPDECKPLIFISSETSASSIEFAHYPGYGLEITANNLTEPTTVLFKVIASGGANSVFQLIKVSFV